VTALRLSMVDHEQIAHKLLSGQPIDLAAFVRQQNDITAHFVQAIPVFPASNGTRAILRKTQQAWQDGLTKAGLWSAQVQAMQGLHLEENPIFGLALAVTWHFRRRMTKDLLRPVASMHLGVLKLRAGELGHRIQVARNDELGELADAFNSMADSLYETHRALTQRATHDSLTGLANRATLAERLAASCSKSPRPPWLSTSTER
jgi:methyl-accepting chemotaxis protein